MSRRFAELAAALRLLLNLLLRVERKQLRIKGMDKMNEEELEGKIGGTGLCTDCCYTR